MTKKRLSVISRSITALAILGGLTNCCAGQGVQLNNNELVAQFGPRGLVAITEHESGTTVHFASDEFAMVLGGDTVDSAHLTPTIRKEEGALAYYYREAGYSIKVVYVLREGWKFLTKRVQIIDSPVPTYTLTQVEPLRLRLREAIVSGHSPVAYLPQFGPSADDLLRSIPDRGFGTFLRLEREQGLMLIVQNPFLEIGRSGQDTTIRYRPGMSWRKEWGPWSSDLAVIGPYRQSGNRIPARMVYEWKSARDTAARDGADTNEVQAFTECLRQFLLHPSPDPVSVEVGWTLNDYQIDVSTAEGRAEYKRVMDTASNLGVQNLLYAPSNHDLALMENDADDWNWEHVLWLGLGQKIRRGEWDVERSPIPAAITEMLDYAKAKHLGVLAYVYPSLPFVQNPGWIVDDPKKQVKNSYATLCSREFQDFLIHELIAFKRRTGIAGYSFDYAFLNIPGSSSYSQWWGWRRVMESLREAEPGIVIDGRQTYQTYGPWSWLAGSYPHPTGNDEQPESFTPYPDLHFDRVSADRTRFVNYWYRNYQFAPEEVIPGYMTHQTPRNVNAPVADSKERAESVYASFRRRDWDYLGYKYSVLSSIATGGWNNVVDMIPGRDPSEFEHFSDADKSWIRYWLQWTVKNKELLKRTKTILGQPAMGHVDGTASLAGDRGYVFLFNPNYKTLPAEFAWDETVGLTAGSEFLLRELYPQGGRLIGQPNRGFWKYADRFSTELQGTSAVVLEVLPLTEPAKDNMVFGVQPSEPARPPQAALQHHVVKIEHARGEIGTVAEVGVLLRNEDQVKELQINGKTVPFVKHERYISAGVRFAGTAFSHSQQISLVAEPDGSFRGTFTVPTRIAEQLAKRREQWPIPWSPDDYKTTWLVPERLLLFLQIAEPSDAMVVKIEMDGSALPVKCAYSSVREHPESFVGWYVDISGIEADKTHSIRLALPKLDPGRLQGLFFDNVENEYTERLSTK
jgi:hypothetical protein